MSYYAVDQDGEEYAEELEGVWDDIKSAASSAAGIAAGYIEGQGAKNALEAEAERRAAVAAAAVSSAAAGRNRPGKSGMGQYLPYIGLGVVALGGLYVVTRKGS